MAGAPGSLPETPREVAPPATPSVQVREVPVAVRLDTARAAWTPAVSKTGHTLSGLNTCSK